MISSGQAEAMSTSLWFLNNLVTVHVNEPTLSIVELTGAAGDTPPLHVHTDEDETFYVLEGEVTVSRDGVEIAYATFGEPGGCAPAVVLVHGWSGNRGYWMHQADFLAERHHVIAVDLGGHGESGLGRDDWNLAAFGDDVVAVIE